jgi:hypothetical protein
MAFEDEEQASPTVTHHEQVAAAFLERIEDAFALIGGLQTPHPKKERFVRAYHTVSVDFIADVAAIVDQTPELETVKRFVPAEARDVLQFLAAYEPAANRVEILLRALRFTMRAKKAEAADAALHVYFLANRYSRKHSGSPLAERAAAMRRTLGRAGRRTTRS